MRYPAGVAAFPIFRQGVNVKDETLNIRLSKEQHATVHKLSQELGLSMAGVLRFLALSEAQRRGLVIDHGQNTPAAPRAD